MSSIQRRELTAVNYTIALDTLAAQLTSAVSSTVANWVVEKLDYLLSQVANTLTNKVTALG